MSTVNMKPSTSSTRRSSSGLGESLKPRDYNEMFYSSENQRCMICPSSNTTEEKLYTVNNLFVHVNSDHHFFMCIYCPDVKMFHFVKQLMVHLHREHRMITQRFDNALQFINSGGYRVTLVCTECNQILRSEESDSHVCKKPTPTQNNNSVGKKRRLEPPPIAKLPKIRTIIQKQNLPEVEEPPVPLDPLLLEQDSEKRLNMLLLELARKIEEERTREVSQMHKFTVMLTNKSLQSRTDSNILYELVSKSSMSCKYCRQAKLISMDKRQLLIHLITRHNWEIVVSPSPEENGNDEPVANKTEPESASKESELENIKLKTDEENLKSRNDDGSASNNTEVLDKANEDKQILNLNSIAAADESSTKTAEMNNENGKEVVSDGTENASPPIIINSTDEPKKIEEKSDNTTNTTTTIIKKETDEIATNLHSEAVSVMAELLQNPALDVQKVNTIEWDEFKLVILRKVFHSDDLIFSFQKESNLEFGQRLCECLLCGVDIEHEGNLFQHWKRSHRGLPMRCLMCSGEFLFAGALFSHLCFGTPEPLKVAASNEISQNQIAAIKYDGENTTNTTGGGGGDENNTSSSSQGVGSTKINFLRYQCGICKDKPPLPGFFNFMVHMRKQHLTCELCLEAVSNQKDLEQHGKKHKLNHYCWKCSIPYVAMPNYTTHLFWKHGTESVDCSICLQKKWPFIYHFCIPPAQFTCEVCGLIFTKSKALIVHKRLHSNTNLRKCPTCPDQFISKKLLDKHIESGHTEKKMLPNGTDLNLNREKIPVSSPSPSTPEPEPEPVKDEPEPMQIDQNDLEVNDKESNDQEEKGPESNDQIEKGPESNVQEDKGQESNDQEDKGQESKVQEDSVDNKSTPVLNDGKEESIQKEKPKKKKKAKDFAISDIKGPNLSEEESEDDDDAKSDEFRAMSPLLPSLEEYSLQVPELPNYDRAPSSLPEHVRREHTIYSANLDHDYCKPATTQQVNLNSGQTHAPAAQANLNNRGRSPEKSIKSPPVVMKRPRKREESSSSSSSSSSSCGSNCSCTSGSSFSSTSDSEVEKVSKSSECRAKKLSKKVKPLKIKPDSKSRPRSPLKKLKITLSKDPNAPPKRPVGRPPKYPRTADGRHPATKPAKPKPAAVKESAKKSGENKMMQILKHFKNPEDAYIVESDLETDESDSEEQFAKKQEDERVVSGPKELEDVWTEGNEKFLLKFLRGVKELEELRPKPRTVLPTPPKFNAAVTSGTLHKTNYTVFTKPEANGRESKLKLRNVPIKPLIVKRFTEPDEAMKAALRKLPPPPNFSSQGKLVKNSRHNTTLGFPSPLKMQPMIQRRPMGIPSKQNAMNPKFNQKSPVRYISGQTTISPVRMQPIVRMKPIISHPAIRTEPIVVQQETRLSAAENQPAPTIEPVKVVNSIVAPISTPIEANAVNTTPTTLPSPVSTTIETTTPTTQVNTTTGTATTTVMPAQIIAHVRQDNKNTKPTSKANNKKVEVQQMEEAEKLYCFCHSPHDNVSQMIGCDGKDCPIEWFHFECVGILIPPKGKWYCPDCREKRKLKMHAMKSNSSAGMIKSKTATFVAAGNENHSVSLS